MKVNIETNRRKALEWWENLSLDMQLEFIDIWRWSLDEKDFRKGWSNDMIKLSSTCIESIYIQFIESIYIEFYFKKLINESKT